MKEFIEEYGGIAAAICGGGILWSLIWSLLSESGGLWKMAEMFFGQIGTMAAGG